MASQLTTQTQWSGRALHVLRCSIFSALVICFLTVIVGASISKANLVPQKVGEAVIMVPVMVYVMVMGLGAYILCSAQSNFLSPRTAIVFVAILLSCAIILATIPFFQLDPRMFRAIGFILTFGLSILFMEPAFCVIVSRSANKMQMAVWETHNRARIFLWQWWHYITVACFLLLYIFGPAVLDRKEPTIFIFEYYVANILLGPVFLTAAGIWLNGNQGYESLEAIPRAVSLICIVGGTVYSTWMPATNLDASVVQSVTVLATLSIAVGMLIPTVPAFDAQYW